MAAVKAILTSGYGCTADDQPDDMTFGMFCKRLGIPILHSPLFHQVCDHSVIMVSLCQNLNFVPDTL